MLLLPRLTAMRVVGVFAVTALITLVTAFDYEPTDLFSSSPETTAITDEPSENAPAVATEPSSIARSEIAVSEIGTFAAPVDVITRTGDTTSYAVELLGSITPIGGQSPILELSGQVLVQGEQGLLGAAFHPSADLLYVHYSDLQGDSVIAEFAIDPETAIADLATQRTVLAVEQPYENHNGGEVDFGPDGYLYLGFGDGGLADDPIRSALDLTSPLGKILRIDPTPTADASFTVPADNPFVEVDGADPTIWAYGLRNPWKFSFDADNGDLWIADVGQNQWEEVNRGPAVDGQDAGKGLSFGWSAFEGDARFNDDQPDAGHTDPAFTYERADGKCSISGGVVYRGTALPALEGWYVYGDYCTGQILAFDTTADRDDQTVVELGTLGGLVAVATDTNGELLAVSVMGPIATLS
jgi:glucose/arabinose dehydrogenase